MDKESPSTASSNVATSSVMNPRGSPEPKRRWSIVGKIWTTVGISVGVLLLAMTVFMGYKLMDVFWALGGGKPVPEDQRYYYVNEELANLNYKDIGEIVSEENDGGNRPVNSASISVKYAGTDTFDALVEKFKYECGYDTGHRGFSINSDSNLASCDLRVVNMNLEKIAGYTILKVRGDGDGFSGNDDPDFLKKERELRRHPVDLCEGKVNWDCM